MKKLFKTLISLFMVTSLAGCSTGAGSSEAGIYTPGTYTGEAQGIGTVKVSVTVDANSITAVEIDASEETASIGGAAAETLAEQIMEAQSTEIDGVSGSTVTTNAVKAAVEAALAEASGTAGTGEKTALTDGTYTETAQGYSVVGPMTGEVTIENGEIASIVITEENDSATSQWFSVAEAKLIPRIIEAQSLAVDSVTGATFSSSGIKTIVSEAIEEAGGNASEWYTAPEKSTEKVVLEDYDVIVVGMGGSGILAYLSAADSGATVFGIEAAGEIGGNSVSTSGPMVINSSEINAKYNNGEDNLDPEDVYNTWIEYVGEDTEHADIIREVIDTDGEIMDYYINNFDFSFDGEGYGGPAGYLGSFVRLDWTKEWIIFTADEDNTKWYTSGPDKLWQFQNALDKAVDMNEKNDYQLELTADELITDDEGNVTGVHAVSYDGTEYEIMGKTVILATGGFLGNDEMLTEVYGSTVHSWGDTVNDGTGIQMGQSVGGATYALGTLPMIHVSQIPNIIRDDSLTADEKAILSALAVTSDRPQVDETGKTLGSTDETGTANSELTVGIAYAPGFHYYNVYTQEDIDNIRTNGLSEAQAAVSIFGLNQGGTLPAAGEAVETIDTIMQVGIDTSNVFKGTPAELAAQMGWDEATVTETLGDADTTYYLVECAGYSYGTVGGLDVDTNMNVLKEDGTPIANLFAVGQDSEGVENTDGEAYTPWGGQAQQWTFVSGKIAGEMAAKVAAGE